ncbi:MAG TPA: hypothetical protein VJW17_07745 [Pyrinomonadaceae bacterium]|nr:hypothetical protein [Pyrinomonadaceae bacterium]
MKTIARTIYLLALTLSVTTVQITSALAQDWPQWGRDPQHTGQINVAAQNLNQNIANILYDSTVPGEIAAATQLFGEADLLVHYQVPLIDGNDVYMEFKSGNASKNTFSQMNWAENKLSWQNGNLVQVWSFPSDWKAPGSYADFWEPVFHSVLANGSLYVPGAGGTIFRVDKSTGAQIARINPFGTIDSNTYTAGPISADSSGNLYYNVVKLQPGGGFYSKDSVDSWLVKVTPSNSITKVSYSVLTPGTPGPDDPCEISFPQAQAPWPPSPTAVSPTVRCGPMRVALNIAPAIAPDGTIYSIARSHAAFANRSGFLVAVNPNLTSKWVASLSNRLTDGCGVPISAGGVLPPNGQPGGCRAGANFGVDPGLNHAGGGRVLDDSSASPTIAPDGSIFYGAYTRYNYAQGHLMHFSSTGEYLGAYRFGWDLTPGIKAHGGTYSVLIKDNQYGEIGSYCDVESACPSDRTVANSAGYPEAYFVTQLNHNLNVEWRFQNTNQFSCTRQPDGSVTCVNDHPNGFEWCVNAMAIDANGVVYANSEDGNLFALNPDGTLKQKIFQQLALGAAYTPASIGLDGKIYSQNAGHLFVVGN